MQGNRLVDYARTLRDCADIEADESYDVDEIKGSIQHRNSVLYHVKWIGFPKKKDWTFEPYENFSEGARTKLLQFHINHPSSPRDHRVTRDSEEKYLSIVIPVPLNDKSTGSH